MIEFFKKTKNLGFNYDLLDDVVNTIVSKRKNENILLKSLTELALEIKQIIKDGKNINPNWVFDCKRLCERIEEAEKTSDIVAITNQLKEESKLVPMPKTNNLEINGIQFRGLEL